MFKTSFIDQLQLPAVVEAVQLKLSQFDLSMLELVKLLRLKRMLKFHGACDYPIRFEKNGNRFRRGYRIRCSVNVNLTFPMAIELAVARSPAGAGDQARVIEFGYELVFADVEEATIWLTGRTVFYFLQHSRQVPAEKMHLPYANALGLDWLEGWRRDRVGARAAD